MPGYANCEQRIRELEAELAAAREENRQLRERLAQFVTLVKLLVEDAQNTAANAQLRAMELQRAIPS